MRTPWKTATGHPGYLIVLICALSVALGFSLAVNLYQQSGTAIAAATNVPTDWRSAFVETAKKLEPSVVFITSEKTVEVSAGMPGLDDLFGFNPFGNQGRAPETEKQTRKASGSGVVVRADGYIMTNNHVVADSDTVRVKLSDGREFKGKVFLDPTTDLAIIKIDAKDLPAVGFADSDKLEVGQWAMAIGNPFGLQNTVTSGVISAIRKSVDAQGVERGDIPSLPYPEVIQTDASINPGNSGGPLVDLDGRIIGINGAIYSKSGGNEGIGFAIPANTAKYVMTQLIEKGKVVRAFLGVSMQDLSTNMGEKLGAKQGVLVTDISEDSAAAKGGVKVKDIIVKIDGKDIANAAELRRTVERMAPGTVIKLTVVREKANKVLNITLQERPGVESASADTSDGDNTGLTVQPLTPDIAKQLDLDEGVKGVVVRKVKAGSPGARAGINQGDVITEIADEPVTSVASFNKTVKSLKSGDTAIVVIVRGKRNVILEMPME